MNEEMYEILYGHPMDEMYIGVPISKKEIEEIQVGSHETRSKNSIMIRHESEVYIGGQTSKTDDDTHRTPHYCSVKVRLNGRIVGEIDIPTMSYDLLNPKSKYFTSLRNVVGDKNNGSSKIRGLVKGFIYENQMTIIAYWNTKNGEESIRDVLTDMMVASMVDISTGKPRSSWKTQDEIDADKVRILEYVRDTLQDRSIKLDFGAQKKAK